MMEIATFVLVGIFFGISSGYLGSFMVLKRMSLVGDALSHVALPGIAIALAFDFNPMLGAMVALLIATFGVWYLNEKSEMYIESLVGIFFTASLSLGLLITPEPELLEALFGDIDKILAVDAFLSIILAITVFAVTNYFSKKITLGIVSEDLARSQKINTSVVNLIYLSLVSLVVAMGVKFLGTLLTGAMVIVPAVSAKNISNSLKSYQTWSVIFGACASTAGILIAKFYDLPSGPIVVLSGVVIFALSYIFKKN